MSKPFSQACENNKQFILDVISQIFQPGETVLEIGSGTAQHILHFASHMPTVDWQPAELGENMTTLMEGLSDAQLANILMPPLQLDVSDAWPLLEVDGVFSANCLHIMAEESVDDFFHGVGRILRSGGNLCVYGPFKYDGKFTTQSNADFDSSLKSRCPVSGIRDFEKVNQLAGEVGLQLVADHSLPANNQLLHWRKN